MSTIDHEVAAALGKALKAVGFQSDAPEAAPNPFWAAQEASLSVMAGTPELGLKCGSRTPARTSHGRDTTESSLGSAIEHCDIRLCPMICESL